jgi:hypothetical protein
MFKTTELAAQNGYIHLPPRVRRIALRQAFGDHQPRLVLAIVALRAAQVV